MTTAGTAERNTATTALGRSMTTGHRLLAALRAMLLRRACAAAKAELHALGDARLLVAGWRRGALMTAIHMFERHVSQRDAHGAPSPHRKTSTKEQTS
jgi:hypothetical protein